MPIWSLVNVIINNYEKILIKKTEIDLSTCIYYSETIITIINILEVI